MKATPFKILFLSLLSIVMLACNKESAPEPLPPVPINSAQFKVNGSALTTIGLQNWTTNNNRLKAQTELISGTDTFVLFLNIPNFRKEPRIYVINLQPNPNNLFPDTTQNFAFYGPKTIFNRKDRTFSNFSLSGSMSVSTLTTTDDKVMLNFTFQNEIQNNIGTTRYTVENGRANISF